MSVLGALVASLRLIDELGGVGEIHQRLSELSGRLRRGDYTKKSAVGCS